MDKVNLIIAEMFLPITWRLHLWNHIVTDVWISGYISIIFFLITITIPWVLNVILLPAMPTKNLTSRAHSDLSHVSLQCTHTIALTPRQYLSHMLLNLGCPPMSQICKARRKTTTTQHSVSQPPPHTVSNERLPLQKDGWWNLGSNLWYVLQHLIHSRKSRTTFSLSSHSWR